MGERLGAGRAGFCAWCLVRLGSAGVGVDGSSLAVNAGQTATACAGITDYLGLVKAQTGKRLTPEQANQLRTDATDLAAALGCWHAPLASSERLRGRGARWCKGLLIPRRIATPAAPPERAPR